MHNQDTTTDYKCYRYRDDRAAKADRKGFATERAIIAWAEELGYAPKSAAAAVRVINHHDGRLLGVTRLTKREMLRVNGYLRVAK